MKKAIDAIKLRAVYARLLLKGDLSFRLVVFLMLPASMRPGTGFIKSFRMFGKPFVTPEGEREKRTLLNLVHEIIGLDQYRVGLIGNKGVVIDAGANMGVFSVFAAARNPQALIYAFEPTPETFETLKKNIGYYPNIKAFNCGLGEKARMASVVITGHSAGNYIGEGGVPIEIRTIDSFGLPASFIKMDTEGYEANILKGAAETIRKHKPIIVMSAYHKPNDDKDLPALLNGIAAYDCELRHDCETDLTCKPRA